MAGLSEGFVGLNLSSVNSTEPVIKNREPGNSELEGTCNKLTKASLWSNFLAFAFSIFQSYIILSFWKIEKTTSVHQGWTIAVKEFVTGDLVRRLQELLVWSKPAGLSSASQIWLLGTCYKVTAEEDSELVAFSEDCSSRIWMTYRKGFDAIPNSKLTSDANWGCMIRSSQMLIAQALLFHHFGRSWRKPIQKAYDPEYIEILHHFGDSMASTFSIHNLLQSGRAYGLAAGSWVGPYAMCKTWETLSRSNKEHDDLANEKLTLPMAIYVVSGNEDEGYGGAPVVCTEVAAKLCYEFSKDELTWPPIVLLVPLVLGQEKVDPRYIPLLRETFTFSQSLGILGGKPGVSTYMVGVQDDKAVYLDPHEIQLAINIRRHDLEADTSSYHCNTVHHMPLDLIDPSLAIGFYCHNKDDFEDFCLRASELSDRSNGAPLFTVAQSLQSTKLAIWPDTFGDRLGSMDDNNAMDDSFGVENFSAYETQAHEDEDEWQIL